MRWHLISALIALTGPWLVLAYDIVAYYVAGKQATISYAVQTWCNEWEELPYLIASVFLFLYLHLTGITLERHHVPPPEVAAKFQDANVQEDDRKRVRPLPPWHGV